MEWFLVPTNFHDSMRLRSSPNSIWKYSFPKMRIGMDFKIRVKRKRWKKISIVALFDTFGLKNISGDLSVKSKILSVSLFFFPTFFSRKIANKTVSVPILIVLYIQRGNRSNRKRKEVQSLHKLTKLCIVWSLHEFHSKLKLGR